MSEDEMIEEFRWRALALIRRSKALKRSHSGLMLYDMGDWGVTLGDVAGGKRVDVQVRIDGHLRVVFDHLSTRGGKLYVEDYEAEEILKDMRAHMVLDDLADA